MVAGGICKNWLSNLILLNGPENEFAYAQILLYFKDDWDRLQKGEKLFFEQDDATAHTTQNNLKLIEKLFGKAQMIRNPPNSPDFAYPIKTIWAYIKPRIKKEIKNILFLI